MKSEILSIGTELLLGQIVDTNASYLSKKLAEVGIGVYQRQTVGDNLERLVASLLVAINRSDIVFTIGGLGPTEDDITREGVAAATGETLVLDKKIESELKDLFAKRNLPYVKSQSRQARRPEGSIVLPNPNGTAPGLIFQSDECIVISLPGPPNEFIPMVDNHIIPFLRERGGTGVIISKTLRLSGIGEASAEDLIRDLAHSDNPTVAPYAKPGEVHFRITARAKSQKEAVALIAPKEKELMERLGDFVYGADDVNLETAVLDLMKTQKQTLSVAESCTGGLLGNRLTNVFGASDVFLGGIIAYSNDIKTKYLNVDKKNLKKYGAVSKETALAMAKEIRIAFGTHWGVGITGIAGPSGGTADKPVGLVYIAIADPSSEVCEEYRLIGSREEIKLRATQSALTLLRKGILKGGCDFS